MASTPTYTVPTDADFDAFRDEALSESPDWELVHDEILKGKKGQVPCKTWIKKSATSSINIIKMFAFFKGVKPETLYEVLHDAHYRPVWDNNMLEGIKIQDIDANNEISYYAAKAPTPVSNRDWLNMRSWRARPEKGEWIIFNKAAEHPNMPPRKGFVRAESIITGYLVRRCDEGCTLNYLTQNDPKGWIPAWLINTLGKKVAPKLILKCYEACLGYDEWKKTQGSSGSAAPAAAPAHDSDEEK